MAFPDRIAIASKNAHKLRELGRICADWPVEWVTVETHDPSAFPDVEETGETYLENALLKARAVAAALGLPAIADDSGIEVDALGGKPGPAQRAVRRGGRHRRAEPGAVDPLAERHPFRRTHRALPMRGRARATPTAPTCTPRARAKGRSEGKRRGSGGFGYDPIFVPDGWDETMAQLTHEQKDRISHRGRAFRALRNAGRGGSKSAG